MVTVDKDKCVADKLCIDQCPTGVLQEDPEGKAEVNGEDCIDCQACIAMCPSDAITPNE